MKITTLLSAFFAFLVCAMPALAQTTPDDRARFVTVVHNLERTPLDPALKADRRWAIQWLTDAPDVSVTVCADVLGGVPADYPHGAEVTVQYILGMAAFAIENPGKAKDQDALQLAGVESALKAYAAMRGDQPEAELDKLLAMQGRGELPGLVKKAFQQCMASAQ